MYKSFGQDHKCTWSGEGEVLRSLLIKMQLNMEIGNTLDFHTASDPPPSTKKLTKTKPQGATGISTTVHPIEKKNNNFMH